MLQQKRDMGVLTKQVTASSDSIAMPIDVAIFMAQENLTGTKFLPLLALEVSVLVLYHFQGSYLQQFWNKLSVLMQKCFTLE